MFKEKQNLLKEAINNNFEDEQAAIDDWDDPNYHETPSCTHGDYGPSHPWDAPGMSIRDFI